MVSRNEFVVIELVIVGYCGCCWFLVNNRGKFWVKGWVSTILSIQLDRSLI